jgi:hypothetical protein
MKLSKTGRGHIIVGAILVAISISIAIALFVTQLNPIGGIAALGFAIFFNGTWGGVEIGRVVESKFREKEGEST